VIQLKQHRADQQHAAKFSHPSLHTKFPQITRLSPGPRAANQIAKLPVGRTSASLLALSGFGKAFGLHNRDFNGSNSQNTERAKTRRFRKAVIPFPTGTGLKTEGIENKRLEPV
jgi:hypothetical protein